MRRVLSTSPNLPDFNQANACSTTHSGRPSPARGYGICSLNDNHHWKQVRRWWGLRFASSHCPRKNSDQIQHKFRLQARRRVIPFTHELWAKQVEVLSRKYRVITYDRRGHGQSEAPKTGYSPVDHAKDLEGLLDQLGVSRAHFVAHSRGGPILLQLLRLNPERVRSLTFVDASIPLVALPDGKKAAIERIRKGTSSLEDALRQREAAKTRFFLKVAQSDPATRQILNRMVDAYSPNVILEPRKK